MNQLDLFYSKAKDHQINHQCGGVPYQQGQLLLALTKHFKPEKVLEIGTGVGYSAFCMSLGYAESQIISIDKDPIHLKLAQENWETENINNIKILLGKVEDLLPTLTDSFDLIFFDGYDPQIKLMPNFGRLLSPNGILVTTNLFLKDPTGGRVLRALKDTSKWQTKVIDDTAISVRIDSPLSLNVDY